MRAATGAPRLAEPAGAREIIESCSVPGNIALTSDHQHGSGAGRRPSRRDGETPWQVLTQPTMEASKATVAVVTGASQGLGLAQVRGLCRKLGAEGIACLTARDRGRGGPEQ